MVILLLVSFGGVVNEFRTYGRLELMESLAKCLLVNSEEIECSSLLSPTLVRTTDKQQHVKRKR